ncbi:MAG: hypothetical protein LKM44_01700 [Wolbachia endosymbiont of Meromenopon meropis]|nr:hypothetical protein [Wolbachia endosymbiont of Meromenopon meropis]
MGRRLVDGCRCFMKSAKLKIKFSFLILILFCPSNGYSNLCKDIYVHTDTEIVDRSIGKGFWNFVTGQWGDLKFDPLLLKEIKVTAVKDLGMNNYFDPKIQVCNYEGDNCYILPNKTSCHQIYGMQATGGGISAAVFIDWEGDIILDGGKIKKGVTEGIGWEWAEGVTDEEKSKFVHSPKICACSQKAACTKRGIFHSSRIISEQANIFHSENLVKTCDTCYQKIIKCAPVPIAPGPPPFCEQITSSLSQVRIVPITNQKNDYFDPRVKVIVGNLIEHDGEVGEKLDFPKKYREDETVRNFASGEVKKHSILDRDGATHYFETYRKKNKLCAEYYGTEKDEFRRKLQFPARCFPSPPAPEPKIVKIVDESTLKIEIKMSRKSCMQQVNASYNDGYCTFDVSLDASNESEKEINPHFFRAIKPKIVEKVTIKNSNNENKINNLIEDILKKNRQFALLKRYGIIPDVDIRFINNENYNMINLVKNNKTKSIKLELDDMGFPKIKVSYVEEIDQKKTKGKILCLSGWHPDPEEFILKRDDEIISLKLIGARYIKYNIVYSKESNQFYYFPCDDTTDILARPQNQLDKIVFNKQGYISIPEENINKNHCIAEKDEELDTKRDCNKCWVVYKLIDEKHKEKRECRQGQDGCLCSDNVCSRSTQYLNKENGRLFYLKYEEVDCKDKDGKTLEDEKGEIQKCTQLKDELIKVDRAEVFYIDKLCKFDLLGLTNRLSKVIVRQLGDKKQKLEKSSQESYGFGDTYYDLVNSYKDDLLIMFDHIEIEVWGSGEAGHIEGTAHSIESRLGMPGDYVKAQLKIDPDYPVIKVRITEAGGNKEFIYTDKDGGPIFIEKCRSNKQDCKLLITVAGGGKYKKYGGHSYEDTVVHEQNLKLEEIITKLHKLSSSEDNKVAYVEDGIIKYEAIECSSGLRSNKPGAGGCINKSKRIYGKGSPGYLKIRPVIKEFSEEKINAAIEKVISDKYSIGTMTDFSIMELDVGIKEIIEREIKKELLR